VDIENFLSLKRSSGWARRTYLPVSQQQAASYLRGRFFVSFTADCYAKKDRQRELIHVPNVKRILRITSESVVPSRQKQDDASDAHQGG